MANWTVTMKKADFQALGERFHIDPVIARIIRNRDLTTIQEFDSYLHGSMADLHAPQLMKDMELAASIILEQIEKHAKIRIIGDYDVDGVCSSFILEHGFRSLGADVDTTIPHRMKDGYGLNMDLIEDAIRDHVDLIVTCDNGIAAMEPIKRAKEAGIMVVVTDHHEVPFIEEQGVRTYLVPMADAVVDPKQSDCHYPFSGICGGFVAYKLIQCMYEQAGVEKLTQAYLANPYFEAVYLSHRPATPAEFVKALGILEFAMLATVCDVMELRDENRILVKEGLKAVAMTENIGLKALLETSDLSNQEVSVYHVGFIIGPCINATGRLDTAERGLELLRCQTHREAMVIAKELHELNESRKAMTLKGLESAIEVIEKENLKEDSVLVVYLPDCHESLAGIIAGRLREKYHKPSIVLTDAENGIKGSGRSIDAYHMYEKLCECKELLSKFGGHKLAAGLSLPKENVDLFRKRLNEQSGLTEEDFEEKVLIDVPMPMSYVTESFVHELKVLEPFGTGNPKPVFAQKNLRFISGRKLGKNRNVGKFVVSDENGKRYDAMLFQQIEEFDTYIEEQFGAQALSELYEGETQEITLMVTYYPDLNEFRGRVTLQFIITHYQ